MFVEAINQVLAIWAGDAPYNTVGKLKNLRIGSDDINAQKKNLDLLIGKYIKKG